MLSFALRQSVALSDPFPRAGGRPRASTSSRRSSASLRFNPYQSTTVDATAHFGNVSHQLDQLSLSANLVGTGKRADKYLGFTYFARLDRPGHARPATPARSASTPDRSLIKERLRADVQLNYDAKRAEFLEQRYLTGWTGSCYGIALEYRRYRVFGSPTDDENLSSYGIAVTLKNVGTIGSTNQLSRSTVPWRSKRPRL